MGIQNRGKQISILNTCIILVHFFCIHHFKTFDYLFRVNCCIIVEYAVYF